MGLKSTFANAAKSAFNAAGDAKITVTYTARTIGGYSPPTDTTAVTETDYSIDVIRVNTTRKELETTEEPKMMEIMFQQADLAVTPELEDIVTIDSEDCLITKIDADPADATWTLTLVRP